MSDRWRAQGDRRGFDEVVAVDRYENLIVHIERMQPNSFFVNIGGTREKDGFRGSIIRDKIGAPWRLVAEGTGEEVKSGWPETEKR